MKLKKACFLQEDVVKAASNLIGKVLVTKNGNMPALDIIRLDNMTM